MCVLAAAGALQAQVIGYPPTAMAERHDVVGFVSGPGVDAVKGAPYSADSVSEFTQVLADGTRIHRNTRWTVARDSEGRTRREQSMGPMGPLAPEGELPQLVIITDPVAGFTYMMNEKEKVASKLPLPKAGEIPVGAKIFTRHAAVAVAGGVPRGAVATAAAGPQHGVMIESMVKISEPDLKDRKEESLGTRTIEGVVADGTRTTITIPAGKVGNDRPLEIVSERWFSKELQTLVLTKHSDPRMGENAFKLTNIVRGEPSRTLFEVPPGYTVKEAPEHGPVIFNRKIERK
jgi:hypothetical protein